jgi:hypothetical protein
MKTILAILITVLMVSCNVDTTDFTRAATKEDSNKLNSEKIMSEVGHGLYKVKVDDSTTVLIYRGVESCTMIQLK